MTRTLFRSMLIALCLTALTTVPARSDSWFNFASRNKTKEVTVETTETSTAQFADDDCDDDDPCDCVECKRGHKHKCKRLARKYNKGNKGQGEYVGAGAGGCYPNLNSSLYPCPQPNVPVEVGQTIITNQAFYPHEMLYPHCYRAIYPPYFYENKCGLGCLPFVPKPCIQGTVVTVKYKSRLPCGYHPPFTPCLSKANLFR